VAKAFCWDDLFTMAKLFFPSVNKKMPTLIVSTTHSTVYGSSENDAINNFKITYLWLMFLLFLFTYA